jgi:exonuclease SbcD
LSSYRVALIGDVHLRGSNPRCRKDNYLVAILDKLEFIFQENDVLIVLGDLFDKPAIEEEALNAFFRLILKYADKPIFSIYGNHDLYKYNVLELDKTSLGVSIVKGFVQHLDSLTLNGITFKEIPFQVRNPIVPETDSNTILLGHYFFENNLVPTYSITREQIIASKSYAVVLGHDHEPYPELSFGGVPGIGGLIRPGSLCRNTANIYQMERIPQYVQFVISQDGSFYYQYREVSVAKSPKEVFNDIVKKPKRDAPVFGVDLDSLLIDFSNREVKIPKLSEALGDLGAAPVVLDHLQKVYRDMGLTYS